MCPNESAIISKNNLGGERAATSFDSPDFLRARSPDVIEDECADEESEKDSNDTIADGNGNGTALNSLKLEFVDP